MDERTAKSNSAVEEQWAAIIRHLREKFGQELTGEALTKRLYELFGWIVP